LKYIEISNKADEEFDLGRIKKAISLLKKGLAIAKEKGHKSYIEFFLGELEYIKGDYESALLHYIQAVKQNSKNPFFLKNLGVTYSLLGKEKKAIELFERALKINPDNYNSLRSKGVSLSKFGKDKQAIELFDRALEINPDDYKSLRSKGVSLSKFGKDEQAIELFERALKINPDDYNSLRSKGVSLSKFGKDEQAIELFNRALKIKPNDYQSMWSKGVSLSKFGKDEQAIELFDMALEINPNDNNSLRSKGVSLSKFGKDKQAIELFERALKINPDDNNSLRSKGVSLSKLGEDEQAIELFERALEINPNDYKSLRSKSLSLSRLRRLKEALGIYNKLLRKNPDDWDVLFSKAFTLEDLSRKREAEEIFRHLKSNLEKIKNEERKDLINFKNAIFEKPKADTPKDEKTSRDILETVVSAFQERKEVFFAGINTIESKFKTFTDTNRSIPDVFPSFLSVLRKWNSYTPIFPSEKGDNKGGGYFLYHKGKGIVIDPGFNFIENFYQEGFKVADIDAVLITHAHNDHTVDLESIITLVYKYNAAIKDSVKEEMKDKTEKEIKLEVEIRLDEKGKKIDLFLNVGTFMKYSGWLNLKDSKEINSVTVLQPDTTYNLQEDYFGITIHTTRAKHDEVIDNKYAIGFILDIEGIKIGFTGDTGWDYENNSNIAKPFIEHKPKLVIAHLGSIKSKEFKYVEASNEKEMNECFYDQHLGLLGITKFLDETKPDLTIISEFGEELRDFRKEIVQGIGDVLKLNCLPGDIGLHIRLKDLGIYCFIDGKFIDFKQTKVDDNELEPNISFHREELDLEKFYTALQRKDRMRAFPLSERINGDPNN